MQASRKRQRSRSTSVKADEHAGLVVERVPIRAHRGPSKTFIQTLEDLGADRETIDIALGKRKYRFRVLHD